MYLHHLFKGIKLCKYIFRNKNSLVGGRRVLVDNEYIYSARDVTQNMYIYTLRFGTLTFVNKLA